MDEKFGDVRLTLSLSVSFWFIGISWYKIYLIFPNLEIPCFAVGPLWGPDSAAIDGPLGLRADLGKDRREGASRQGGEYGCPYLRSSKPVRLNGCNLRGMCNWFFLVVRAPTIIKNLISHEVEEAHDVETLFRANSIGSKAFDMYMKMCGFHFLYDIVHPTVSQIYEEKRSMEVSSWLQFYICCGCGGAKHKF